MQIDDSLIAELNKTLLLVAEMGFIVGLAFGVLIGWILYSCLKQYYRPSD